MHVSQESRVPRLSQDGGADGTSPLRKLEALDRQERQIVIQWVETFSLIPESRKRSMVLALNVFTSQPFSLIPESKEMIQLWRELFQT